MSLAPLFFLSTTFQGQWVTTVNRFANGAVRLAVLVKGYDGWCFGQCYIAQNLLASLFYKDASHATLRLLQV